MQYEGNVYRPPSEAHSLLIQTTIGCAWNRCTFCDMYAGEQFRIRELEEIKQDLIECSVYQNRFKRIFLCDGDALVLNTETLAEILGLIRQLYPNLEGVRAYASARDVLAKTTDELRLLQSLGLDMVYIGLESGSDAVLQAVNKGITKQQMIEAAKRLKKAGIQQSISIIAGLGGTDGWQQHMLQTADALNQMQPEYLGLLVLTPRSDGKMHQVELTGSALPSEQNILREMLMLVEHLELENCLFSSAHVSNYIHIRGHLPQDKPALVKTIQTLLKQSV